MIKLLLQRERSCWKAWPACYFRRRCSPWRAGDFPPTILYYHIVFEQPLCGCSVLKWVGIKCLFAVDDLLDVLLLSLNTPVHVFLTLWDFISVSFSRKCDFFWKIWLILTALTPLSLLPPASSHLLIPPSVSRLSVGALPPSPPPSLCCLRLPAESVSNPALLLRGDPLPFLHLSYSFF